MLRSFAGQRPLNLVQTRAVDAERVEVCQGIGEVIGVGSTATAGVPDGSCRLGRRQLSRILRMPAVDYEGQRRHDTDSIDAVAKPRRLCDFGLFEWDQTPFF